MNSHTSETTKANIFRFQSLLIELSLAVTTLMLYSAKYNIAPYLQSPLLYKLMNIRLGSSLSEESSQHKKGLPVLLIESVLSDQALAKIHIQELLKFREKTSGYFEAWKVETDKLEAALIEKGFSYKPDEIEKFIKSEINPKLLSLKQDIEKIKRDLFQKVIHSVANTTFTGIGCSFLSSVSVPAAVTAFLVANFKNAKLISEIIGTPFTIQDAKTNNAFTYLQMVRKIPD